VYGNCKEKSSQSFKNVLGYHPILLHIHNTGELLDIIFRPGAEFTSTGAAAILRDNITRLKPYFDEIILLADAGFYEKSVIEIGDNVSVGHNATIHGAKIHRNVLVGIGAIILDDAEIGENSIIAAGSVVLEKTIVEPNSIYAGIPAKKIKTISPDQTAEMIKKIAHNYIMYAKWYREDFSI